MKTQPSQLAYTFRSLLLDDLAKAESFLKKNPQLINQTVYGATESALHFFAVEDEVEIVSWLLAHGADPNGIKNSTFPIHEAAALGNLKVCKLLLKEGANPDLQDRYGETALHKAASHGYLEIIEILLAHGADPNIPELCDELPIEQSLPRKQAEIRAIFEKYAHLPPKTPHKTNSN